MNNTECSPGERVVVCVGRQSGDASSVANAFSGWGNTCCGRARQAYAARERARKASERAGRAQETLARGKQEARERELHLVLSTQGDEFNASAHKKLSTFLENGAMLHTFHKGRRRITKRGKWGAGVAFAALRKLKRSPMIPMSQQMASAESLLRSIRRPFQHAVW